eukprot:1145349-Pelagomonas_calceolata.AAC.1
MGRKRKVHSAGEYKLSLKHGVSNKFQACRSMIGTCGLRIMAWMLLVVQGRMQVVWDRAQLPHWHHVHARDAGLLASP